MIEIIFATHTYISIPPQTEREREREREKKKTARFETSKIPLKNKMPTARETFALGERSSIFRTVCEV
jgi:hypothetical protein